MPHHVVPTLFAWLISHQPAVLFSHNEPATSNQPAVLFSQKNQHQPSATSQPNRPARPFLVGKKIRLSRGHAQAARPTLTQHITGSTGTSAGTCSE
jgi:hypothetical protein